MNDTAIKNFCIWARDELRGQVRQKLMEWEIVEDASAELDAIGGHPLTAAEKRQRRELLTQLAKLGEDALVERAAYTWFNRLMAIRYMEANDYLPAHVRLLSNADGSCGSQAVKEALTLDIEGLDRDEVVRLVQQGDDEALFRHIFLAQCDELARCMPAVFEPIGSAMELLLPSGLLRDGSVPDRMVRDIPEEDWRAGVQIVGWMYQYYNAERKTEVDLAVKSGKKVSAADLPPKTTIYTPDWIVRYLVENSLGRLWMRSHPASRLVDRMPYYIPDEDPARHPEHGEGSSPLSPESITVIDPACGSGHILVYAFDLLAAMYEEEGYALRDIPRLVLENNLTGVEIDLRAAAMASFALTMKGRERDARFLSRGVTPSVVTEVPVKLEGEELALVPDLADRAKLLDTMEHADECGSLFKPEAQDMDAIDEALDRLRESDDLFADSARDKLERMRANCEPLACNYDCLIGNPPWLGSSNMNTWLCGWVKKTFPITKNDLCTCFIERALSFLSIQGSAGLATSNSWMFISSYEKLRANIIQNATITSLVQLSVHGFKGIAAQACAFTLEKECRPSYRGAYIRLFDFDHHSLQEPKTLEAIANPDCGWLYRRSADAFSAIPGTPIAYWASDAMIRAFRIGKPLKQFAKTPEGLKTGDNDKFLRFWWECQLFNSAIKKSMNAHMECTKEYKWFPCNKGGQYRKWFGNNEYLVDFENNGSHLLNDASIEKRNVSCYNRRLLFAPLLSWSRISSGKLAMRHSPAGSISETTGPAIFSTDEMLSVLQGFLNSEISSLVAKILSPTLDFRPGQLSLYPIIQADEQHSRITKLVKKERALAKFDWDSFETSWDFQRHPMV